MTASVFDCITFNLALPETAPHGGLSPLNHKRAPVLSSGLDSSLEFLVFGLPLQRRLMESIEQANVFENFDMALEHNPEAFSSVCML